jgi:two-component system NtrC family sensor kinase
MRIRNKVIGLILGLFVVLAAAQYGVQRLILIPSFTVLERQNARTDMTRVIHALGRELYDLRESAQGFGNWADSYQYMQDRNAAFAANNLHPGSAIAVGIDVLVLMDTRGKFVWSTGLRPGSAVSGDTAESMDIDFVTAGTLPAGHPWRPVLDGGTAVNGLIKTDKGILLAAMTPVLDGHGRGPSRGAVIFARFLTQSEVGKLAAQAETSLSMLDSVEPARAKSTAVRTGQDPLVEQSDVTEVSHTFADINDLPVVTLRSTSPRSISAKGRSTAVYAAVFLLGGGALLLTLLVWALNRMILSPLNRITKYAVTIGEQGADTTPLTFDRSDELGTLAVEFNQMLERLGGAHRELVDRSFAAGVAEMASGTLHNIGNAMTPLAVHASSLLHKLRAAPAADVELVLLELTKESGDTERHADLMQFLRLTSAELARVLKEAEHDLGTIERQAQAVQEALAVQRAFTGNGPATENIALEQVILRSIEIVPPALRAALDIEIEPSLRAVGPVRTSRTILQQVFQNLVVNAAEAVLGTGRARGRLRISAHMVDRSGSGLLRIRFEDDGPGVAPENMQRIFARGFSTKAQETNSGIGLHWCANALTALGGRICVDQGDSQTGACIEVSLPADRRQANSLTQAA